MKNYRQQNGCRNCKHVFVWSEYDDASVYYCTFGAPKRPPCLSYLMGEIPYKVFDYEASERASREWREWSNGRMVSREGVCDNWAGRNESNDTKS